MQAYQYDAMLEMIRVGKLHPEKLVGKTISLEESLSEFANMHQFKGIGMTVINAF